MAWLFLHWTVGGVLVLLGLWLNVRAMRKRETTCKWGETDCDTEAFRKLLRMGLWGNLVALAGFLSFTKAAPAPPERSYGTALTVLSLLSAGVISGFFTFSYQHASKRELPLARKIGTSFAVLFYLLFGAVAFYVGRSKVFHEIELAWLLIPVIMFFILRGNTYFDFWDYLYEPPQKTPGGLGDSRAGEKTGIGV